MSGPLSHIRVLDLSRVLAGPWATQNLADMGAEVIKIERPGAGDDTRSWGPYYLHDPKGNRTGESAYFLAANRGKKSVAVDISTEEGRRVVVELARRSDVLVENYKVGGLKKYGLDYDSLKAVSPGLIYCSITGFGQDGPYAPRAGYDFMIQAMGGLMSVTGEADDRPGGGPQKAGVALADVMTGLYATIAVTSALVHRERTGEGQYIDMALLDVQVATLANQATSYLVSREVPKRYGNAHMSIVPYQSFATKDGHMILAVGNDTQFARFCEVAGHPELAHDPRYASNLRRLDHRAELVPLLEEITRTRTTAEWITALEKVGVPCGPINTIEEVFENPQVKARGLELSLPHVDGGTAPGVRSPLRFSATPVSSETAPPALGQHTQEVLENVLGLSADDVAALEVQGAVSQRRKN
ncbi:CoA transferase [Stappia sp. F7233]|uniref:CoA transferase n=1 Tax=Stappia albiluteola TaxID=2758565 RepID=A0A839AE74_9HYPH|nr:CaiB/BaiF CoA-transferase family protein [Stappia albiluteola]MBA5777212.1 CoA transferase [Stappia albiluteola]